MCPLSIIQPRCEWTLKAWVGVHYLGQPMLYWRYTAEGCGRWEAEGRDTEGWGWGGEWGCVCRLVDFIMFIHIDFPRTYYTHTVHVYRTTSTWRQHQPTNRQAYHHHVQVEFNMFIHPPQRIMGGKEKERKKNPPHVYRCCRVQSAVVFPFLFSSFFPVHFSSLWTKMTSFISRCSFCTPYTRFEGDVDFYAVHDGVV